MFAGDLDLHDPINTPVRRACQGSDSAVNAEATRLTTM
jgi:hypothetical protein